MKTLKVRISFVMAGMLIAIGGATWLYAAPTKKDITITAKEVVSQKVEANRRVTTFTQARVRQDDATFSAEKMVVNSDYNPKSKKDDMHEIICTGNPVYKDIESTVTSDRVTAWSSPRRAEFVGNVKMVNDPTKNPKKKANPKGEARDQFSTELSTTTSDKLSYDYGNKRAIATGNVTVVQKERTIWADQGVYDQKLELITLRGNVRLKNTGDDELKELYDAETVTISLETDWIDIVAKQDGFVTIELEVSDEEEPVAQPKTEVPAPGKK